ncbi:MAG: glycosyltransferase [Hyphomicrobiales bacterium]
MARIVMIVSNPCTADARVIKMAEGAAEAGHEVHIFATAKKGVSRYETVNGITYHRLSWNLSAFLRKNMGIVKYSYKIHRWIGRFWVYMFAFFVKFGVFANVFSEQIAQLKPDIIHAHDLITLPAGHRAAVECGAKLIYDAHELEVHRAPPLPIHKKMFTYYIERKYASKSDGVITVGEILGEILARQIGRDDLVVALNSPVIGESSSNIREDLRLTSGELICVYVGKITLGRGIIDVIDLLPDMPELNFVAVGPNDPTALEEVRDHAQALGVTDRFFVLPPVHFKEVVNYIRGADVGILSVEPISLSYEVAMPNKLFEMSFADIPIITNDLVNVKLVVNELKNGEITDFKSTGVIGYKIEKLLRHRDQYKMNEETKQILEEKYSWRTQMNNVLGLYEKVLNS